MNQREPGEEVIRPNPPARALESRRLGTAEAAHSVVQPEPAARQREEPVTKLPPGVVPRARGAEVESREMSRRSRPQLTFAPVIRRSRTPARPRAQKTPVREEEEEEEEEEEALPYV